MRFKLFFLCSAISLASLVICKEFIVIWFSHRTIVNLHREINDLLRDIKAFRDDSTVNLTSKKTGKRFAVFACSIHSSTVAYTFYAPLTAAAWQRVGYEVIVIFVGDFRLEEALSLRYVTTRRFLRQIGAKVLDIQCNASYATKISQLVRVFVGLFPAYIVKDDDSVITTDSDLIPIDNRQYEPNMHSDGFLINPDCCGNFKRRGKKYRMFAMSYIYLTKKTWRAILHESVQKAELLPLYNDLTILSSEAPLSFETINLYAQHEFKNMYHQNMTKGDSAWYMDQLLCSMLLTDYRKRHPNLVIIERNLTMRLDRDSGLLYWNKSNFEQFGDAHLPHDEIFTPTNWEIIRNLLTFLFNDFQVKIFDRYYEKYRIIGNRMS